MTRKSLSYAVLAVLSLALTLYSMLGIEMAFGLELAVAFYIYLAGFVAGIIGTVASLRAAWRHRRAR
jgi:hypothetical protein